MGKKTENKFICDFCSKEKSGVKHKVYDENWNIQRGIYECNDCYGSRLLCDDHLDESNDEQFNLEKFIEVSQKILEMESLPKNNIEKWNQIFNTLLSLKNDHDKLIEFLKSFFNESSDIGTLRTILISMKGYPKENQELHDVMEKIKTLHGLKLKCSTP